MEGEFPEDMKCPVCFEIPENEIFQCRYGHTLCANCAKSVILCPQCRVKLGRNKTRNRALENLLDMMKFDCAYKTNGCKIKLSRKDVTNHNTNCIMSGVSASICEHLGYGCKFLTNSRQLQDSLSHLEQSHQFLTLKSHEFEIRLKNFKTGEPGIRCVWKPILVNVPNSNFIIIASLSDTHVWFSCISLENEMYYSKKWKLEFCVVSRSKQVPALEWSVTPIHFTLVDTVMQNPPFLIAIDVLEKHYLKNGDLVVEVLINERKVVAQLALKSVVDTRPDVKIPVIGEGRRKTSSGKYFRVQILYFMLLCTICLTALWFWYNIPTCEKVPTDPLPDEFSTLFSCLKVCLSNRLTIW